MGSWLRYARPRGRRIRSLLGLSTAFAVVQLLSSQIPPVNALFGIGEQQRFKFEGFIDVGSLGLEDVNGMVAALGDIDGEQFLELFVLSADQRSVSLYSWNRAKYTFQAIPGAQPVSAPFVITNVVPGDLDYDGRLDLLLMGQENPGGWWSDEELQMQAYRGLGRGQFDTARSIPSSALQQPMPFDAQGDMRVHLLGFPHGDEKQQNLKVWQNSWHSSNSSNPFTIADPPLDLADFDCVFPNPHSNAFIDLDGDCLADLFLVCRDPNDSSRLSYQIWTNAKTSGFRLAQKGALPAGAGQISFADMDRDGTMDMVFPTCTSSDGCAINIAYNQQMPLCATSAGLTSKIGPQSQRCRETGNLCIADPQFSFDLSTSDTNPAFQTIPMATLVPDASHLVLTDPSFRGNLPNPIRIGDFDKDGYPDLLIVSASSSSAHQGRVSLLQSIPCNRRTCSRSASDAGRRYFQRAEGPKAIALNQFNDAKSAHFIDIDEDGLLDILVQRSGGGGGASRTLSFIKNNYFHDAFFMKTLVGNGACDGLCEDANRLRYNPYGVSYSGASYKFTVLDTAGNRKATQVGQLPQTGYLSMQTPYSYFGLGRTNNYVENLFVGSTRHQSEHFMTLEGLIPNSQVVVVPYQPADVEDPSTWNKQLFLQPGWWFFWVGVALVTSFVGLAIVVLVLSLNEKRQDELERKHAVHLINFDAL